MSAITPTAHPGAIKTFADLGLRPESLRALAEMGFETPTSIQAQAIPALLEGADMIGQAQTGTGKTAAFALPLLERIDPKRKCVQGIVLTPTRELALQVCEAMHHFSKYQPRIRFTPVYGGQPIVPQMKKIDRGTQIVVGTPGRTIDLMKRGVLKLDQLSSMVLDEADEMLRMGFIDDVEWILAQAPARRQLALFSATMPHEIKRIAQRHLSNPVHIEVASKALALPNIAQSYLLVRGHEKIDALARILESQPIDAALIFVRTKASCGELAGQLTSRGITSEPLNGDMSQSARELVVRRVKSGKVKVLVATDLAARGLDIDRISHVINFDIPGDVESYVHRIGRTGRAGSSGATILFVTPRERGMLQRIERFMKSKVSYLALPSHEDVIADRKRRLADKLRAEMASADLGVYREVVEALAQEGVGDLALIAAAAARLVSSDKPLDVPPSEMPGYSRQAAAGAPDRPHKRPFRKSGPNGEPYKSRVKSTKPRRHKEAASRHKVRKPPARNRARTSS